MKKLIVGKTYKCHKWTPSTKIYDINDNVYSKFEVVSRTEKTVTLKDESGNTFKRKIFHFWPSGNEFVQPFGKHSITPTIFEGNFYEED